MAPNEYKQLSDNGQHKVTVSTPNEKEKIKSQIVVFTKYGDKWLLSWKITAVNPVQPACAYVDSNGSCVITIGNWYGRDDGNDEIVVYRKGKVIKQYSVDDLLGGHFRPEFHSSIGAEWLRDSYSFFDKDQYFCLWVDFVKKWVVIDLSQGTLLKPDKEIEFRCETQARKVSYENINSGEGKYSDYRRLARFLHVEDKPVFEKLLMRPDENLLCGYSTGIAGSGFYYFISNEYRELAEMVLNTLERGEKDAIHDFDKNKDYRHLGSLSISATFEQAPRKEEGVIVLWFEPIEHRSDAIMKERPAHTMGIDLKWHFPFELEETNKPIEMPVLMIIYGITPGKYRIRGYWSKDIKYLNDIEGDFWKRTGDLSIIDSMEVEIRKGRSTDAIVSFKKKEAPNKPDAGDGK